MKTHINDTPMFKYLKLHFDATTALKVNYYLLQGNA